MYFYNLSEGEYSDYSPQLIMHEKQFTVKEFAGMYNQILFEIRQRSEDERYYVEMYEVADLMCEKYGFEKVVEEIEFNKDYGKPAPIKINLINEECRHLRVSDYDRNNKVYSNFWEEDFSVEEIALD